MKGWVKMKKKKIYLMFFVLLSLVGIYALVIHAQAVEGDGSLDEGTISLIFNHDLEDVQTITLRTDNQQLIFENNNNQWEFRGNDDLLVDQVKVFELINQLTRLSGSQLDRSSANQLEFYGFDQGKNELFIERNNGEQDTYLLGDPLPTGAGYYLYDKTNEVIYTINNQAEKLLRTTANDLLFIDQPEQNDHSVFKELSYQRGSEYFVIKPVIENKENVFSHYYLAEPYDTNPQLDEASESFEKLIQAFTMIPPIDVIASEDVEEHGLDNPQLELRMLNLDDRERVIQIGNPYKPGYYYARFDEEETIYSVYLAEEMQLFELEAMDLVHTAPVMTFIDQVSMIEIKTNDLDYQFEFIPKPDSEQDDISRVTELSFLLNDIPVEDKDARAWFVSLLELNADADVEQDSEMIDQSAELSLLFHFKNGATDQIDYLPYNQDFYLIKKNEQSDFVIAKNKMKHLLNELVALIES